QTVAPPDTRALGLADNLRLVKDGQRQHPARVLQCHEPAESRLASGQRGNLIDEFGSRAVTVKVTHSESGIRAVPKKTSGLPQSLRPCARGSHRAQERPLGRGPGTSIIDPAERSAACDPVVTSMMSSGATSIDVVAPRRS